MKKSESCTFIGLYVYLDHILVWKKIFNCDEGVGKADNTQYTFHIDFCAQSISSKNYYINPISGEGCGVDACAIQPRKATLSFIIFSYKV